MKGRNAHVVNTNTLSLADIIQELKIYIKGACTSAPNIEKIMKRYPIISVQIINYQFDQMHK